MNIENLILAQIKKKGSAKVRDIVEQTGYSRIYIHSFFKSLQQKGKIFLIGKANKAHYILKTEQNLIKKGLQYKKILKNHNLAEDIVFEKVKNEFEPIKNLPKNIYHIFQYAFLEMLNNAIEHSKSEKIEIIIKKEQTKIEFSIVDNGVGIYANIIKKKQLKNELEAIQDLLKGKETTMPKSHSGEGIFFTSKMGDKFIIEAGSRKLIIDNEIEDIFIEKINTIKGTRIQFSISEKSSREITSIFKKYTSDYAFNITQIVVKLYQSGTSHISRSQAKRLLHNLHKFDVIILDFDRVEIVGQAFADEIFRVWQKEHQHIRIEAINADENVNFMINRARAAQG